MRLVSHPNIVDLKAFFYSNGEKVPYPHSYSNLQVETERSDRMSWKQTISFLTHPTRFVSKQKQKSFRRMRSISTLSSSTSQRPSTVPPVTTPRSSRQCQC